MKTVYYNQVITAVKSMPLFRNMLRAHPRETRAVALALLACYVALVGGSITTFRKGLSVPPSRVKQF